MYCELFKLTEPPFRLTPDPQFLYASKQHARAKAYMESTIWLADGFVVITGDIGSGKTTLIESFLSELPEDVVLAHVNQTQLSPVEFLQALLVEFGFQPFRMRKIELLTMLRDYMIEQYAAGKKILLVVDEAQNLARAVLEEIRMLSGIEAQKEKLLRIILAGQPELSAKLDSPRLEQLTQRVRLRFHLGALSKRETRDYVLHRLQVAGAQGRRIFSDDALDLVFRYSGGVPRLTNIICDTALLCAFAEERDSVDARLIKAAAEELQWVEYNARPRDHSSGSTGQYVAPAQASASVELLFRDQFVNRYQLSPGRLIIGRTPDNDVQIRSKFISRHHAQITTDQRQTVIEDLNSTNGVYIGAQRVKQHVLRDGDVVQLGEHRLVFRDVRPSGSFGDRDPFTSTDARDGGSVPIADELEDGWDESDVLAEEQRPVSAPSHEPVLRDEDLDDALSAGDNVAAVSPHTPPEAHRFNGHPAASGSPGIDQRIDQDAGPHSGQSFDQDAGQNIGPSGGADGVEPQRASAEGAPNALEDPSTESTSDGSSKPRIAANESRER